ncbi:MAG: capsular polysaccharide synthesis protein [Paludibacteraceae bacterium]|nr:capsular polysaccharide synthesis protein [Paludibacteraceae bacterium]
MKLLQAIQQRGLKCLWYKFKNTYLKPDRDILEIGARNGSLEYLKRYANVCGSSIHEMERGEKIIWVCWLQGIKNAPILVQKCVESIHKYAGDYKVVELTNNNISQYVTLPEYIWEKYRKGTISHIHFSDALRYALLTERGGIWMDATVLLTGELPSYAVDSPLFVYHSDQKGSSLLSVNFISAYKHHPLVEDTYHMILAYWQAENRTIDYNMTAVFWTIAVYANQQNTELWNKVLFVPTGLKEILINELNEPYSVERWQQICALSSVHKLSYKFADIGIDTDKQGTFYDVLFNQKN